MGDDIKPYIAFALEQFGSDRCFCGGDWPVSLLQEVI
jgi:L-fuconolactonase